MALFSTLGGLSALLFLIVPVGRVTLMYPDQVIFEVSCTPESPISLSLYQEFTCTPLTSITYEIEMKMETCGFICQAVANDINSKLLLNTRSYGIKMHNFTTNSSTVVSYEVSKSNSLSSFDSPVVINKAFKNDERYTIAIRKLSKHAYFFPTRSLYNFSCGTKLDVAENDSFSCIFGTKDHIHQLKNRSYILTAGINPQTQTEDNIAENRQMYNVSYFKVGENKHDSMCSDSFPRNKEYVSVNVLLESNHNSSSYKTVELGSCAPRCIATSPRKNVCSNKKVVEELDIKVTFWSYLSVRVFIGMISGTAFAMFEGAVIAVLREHKADYGLQRIYATIGGMISSPLSGWLIDYASKGKNYTDFR